MIHPINAFGALITKRISGPAKFGHGLKHPATVWEDWQGKKHFCLCCLSLEDRSDQSYQLLLVSPRGTTTS